MKHHEVQAVTTLPRTNSCKTNNNKIIPANYTRLKTSSSLGSETSEDFHQGLLVPRPSTAGGGGRTRFSGLLRSLLHIISFPTILPTCRWLNIPTQLSITPSLGRKVTGTLFGHRRGHVTFAVQDDPRSEPVLLIELAVSTSTLVKEMSSGLVRIALECEKGPPPSRGGGARPPVRLFNEPMWTMYCNGRTCGYALSRACTESDWHVLSTVQTVTVGAGVIPVVDDGRKNGCCEGELLYMRARFERVVGSRDSEAFYMLNPDGNGGPELSIFLLRI